MIHLFHVKHPLNPNKAILAILTEHTMEAARNRVIREFGTCATVTPVCAPVNGEFLVVTLL